MPSFARSPAHTGSLSPITSPISNFPPTAYQSISPNGYPQSGSTYTVSPTAERRSIDHSSPKSRSKGDNGMINGTIDMTASSAQTATVLLRKLPSSMSKEALFSMLLFAEGFMDVRFASVDSSDDPGFLSAIAHFRSVEGAYEVRNKLHGRMNATNDATMVVEVLQASPNTALGIRRTTSDGMAGRQMSTSTSSINSVSSNGAGMRHPSRYSGTFQSMDKISPTKTHQSLSSGEAASADSNTQIQGFFSPQSPIGMSFGIERLRISGKSVINDDIADHETGALLRDPLSFAKGGQSASGPRSSVSHSKPISKMANLHLNTEEVKGHENVPMSSGYGSGRPVPSMQSPTSEFGPAGMQAMSPTSGFPLSPQFQRPHYPPANPADQNPPCNTLYVGNLPVDTSEDELKAMFSKQRGYKRLCFRTKHNGPMCFVEFEDITFATKALNELYGQPLHNSVKGGIRLSFSKNPLGVRTGQGNGMGPQSPLSSPNGSSNFGSGIGCPPGFSMANGPPPGLSMPPGLSPPSSMGRTINQDGGAGGFFAHASPPSASISSSYTLRRQTLPISPISNGYGLSSANGGFPDYMLGR